ncbi:MAG: phosphoribosyltransferase [Candidatus Moraniibacteriota bacterium]
MSNLGSKKGKNYILTHDIGDKISSFNKYGIHAPVASDPIFSDFQEELKVRLERVTGYSVLPVSMRKMTEDVIDAAFERKRVQKNAVVISSCPEIAKSESGWIEEGHVINVNRLIDGVGNFIGIGSRPGYPPIESQMERIRSAAISSSFTHPLILVEDGIFSGSTLLFLLQSVRDAGLKIDAIVVGFAFSRGLAAVKRQFDGDIIVINEIPDLVDWMPDHDFVPFSPSCGRVIGVSINGSSHPFYSEEGCSYSAPYLLPFAPIEKWASIPFGKSSDFSLFCATWSLHLFQKIEDMNKKKMLIGDLIVIKPQISIPLSVGQRRLPSLSTRIIDFLSDLCHELV